MTCIMLAYAMGLSDLSDDMIVVTMRRSHPISPCRGVADGWGSITMNCVLHALCLTLGNYIVCMCRLLLEKCPSPTGPPAPPRRIPIFDQPASLPFEIPVPANPSEMMAGRPGNFCLSSISRIVSVLIVPATALARQIPVSPHRSLHRCPKLLGSVHQIRD